MYLKQVVLTSYMPIILFHMLTLYKTYFISSTFFIFKNPKKVLNENIYKMPKNPKKVFFTKIPKSQNSIILKNLKSKKRIKKTPKIVLIKVDFTKIR